MKNSYNFFENIDCEYYPCHKEIQTINCLFCYCPLYNLKDCPGNPKFIKSKDNRTKDCSKCTFPHKFENYEMIVALLESYHTI